MPALTPGDAISTRLRAVVAVTNLVAQRVYPTKPQQDSEWPYLVCFKVSGGGGNHLGGRNITQNYLMRIECYAATQTAADAVMKEVRTALSGWRDLTESVERCLPADDNDDQPGDDGNHQIVGQSFSLWFRG